MEMCEKHGEYSVFCRACDLETLDAAGVTSPEMTHPQELREKIARVVDYAISASDAYNSDVVAAQATEHLISLIQSARPSTGMRVALEKMAKAQFEALHPGAPWEALNPHSQAAYIDAMDAARQALQAEDETHHD